MIITPHRASYVHLQQIKKPKKVYTNHGFHIVGKNDGKDTYAYTKLYRQEHFDAMLEPNKRIAEIITSSSAQFKNVVKFVGWKYAESEYEFIKNKESCRKQLNIPSDKPVVFIASTWSKDNLFNMLGDDLFEEIQKLKNQYYFILSTHPREYILDGGCGAKVDAQKERGIRVKEISENWLPYMGAADVVISDYSTLTENAILLGKKTILSNYPDCTIWKDSIMGKTRPYLKTIHRVEEMGKLISEVLKEDIPEIQREQFNDVYVTRAEYESRAKAVISELLEEK